MTRRSSRLSSEGFPLPFVIPLTGVGDQNARRAEIFQQVANKEVDVLFVIDDSCSMEENQREVAANFDEFIDAADERQVDFRLGITTTDTTQDPGLLVGPVISRATRNFKEVFRQQAAVGIFGSGIETGLDAMQAALDEADRGTPFNADLLRETAALVVIIVSDEDDQSAFAPPQYANRPAAANAQRGSHGRGFRSANGVCDDFGQRRPRPELRAVPEFLWK